MRFQFSLEAVLKQRRRLEEAAQREFAIAQSAVQQTLQKIDGMYKRIDEIRFQISDIQTSGGKNTVMIQQLEGFIDGQKIRIENERVVAREQMEVAEEKQEVLMERARDHKALKVLKEKQYKEFLKEKKKKEEKAIQDIVTMRYRRSS